LPVATRRIDIAVFDGVFFDTSLKFENDIGTSHFESLECKALAFIRNGNVEPEHGVFLKGRLDSTRVKSGPRLFQNTRPLNRHFMRSNNAPVSLPYFDLSPHHSLSFLSLLTDIDKCSTSTQVLHMFPQSLDYYYKLLLSNSRQHNSSPFHFHSNMVVKTLVPQLSH
jgi:hypothetical protein